MPSVYAGTDIISCLRSKYIMRRQPYITLRQRYIIKNFSGGVRIRFIKNANPSFLQPLPKIPFTQVGGIFIFYFLPIYF